jgi:hypothetical protein
MERELGAALGRDFKNDVERWLDSVMR